MPYKDPKQKLINAKKYRETNKELLKQRNADFYAKHKSGISEKRVFRQELQKEINRTVKEVVSGELFLKPLPILNYPKTTKICLECGNKFFTLSNPTRLANHGKFCSKNCFRLYQKKHTKRIEVPCDTCGKITLQWANRVATRLHFFCGKECYLAFHSKITTIRKNHNYRNKLQLLQKQYGGSTLIS